MGIEMDGHKRGCEGRNYTCTCGYDDECDNLRQLIQEHVVVLEMQKDEIARLREEITKFKSYNNFNCETCGYSFDQHSYTQGVLGNCGNYKSLQSPINNSQKKGE